MQCNEGEGKEVYSFLATGVTKCRKTWDHQNIHTIPYLTPPDITHADTHVWCTGRPKTCHSLKAFLDKIAILEDIKICSILLNYYYSTPHHHHHAFSETNKIQCQDLLVNYNWAENFEKLKMGTQEISGKECIYHGISFLLELPMKLLSTWGPVRLHLWNLHKWS